MDFPAIFGALCAPGALRPLGGVPLLGLFLAAGAVDEAMYVFGLSLAAFAYIFIFGQVRRHCDAADAVRHEVGRHEAGHG